MRFGVEKNYAKIFKLNLWQRASFHNEVPVTLLDSSRHPFISPLKKSLLSHQHQFHLRRANSSLGSQHQLHWRQADSSQLLVTSDPLKTSSWWPLSVLGASLHPSRGRANMALSIGSFVEELSMGSFQGGADSIGLFLSISCVASSIQLLTSFWRLCMAEVSAVPSAWLSSIVLDLAVWSLHQVFEICCERVPCLKVDRLVIALSVSLSCLLVTHVASFLRCFLLFSSSFSLQVLTGEILVKTYRYSSTQNPIVKRQPCRRKHNPQAFKLGRKEHFQEFDHQLPLPVSHDPLVHCQSPAHCQHCHHSTNQQLYLWGLFLHMILSLQFLRIART